VTTNGQLAMQLGDVQGTLRALVAEMERARDDRARIVEKQEKHELALAAVAASAASAAHAATTVAQSVAEAVKRIEVVQTELTDTIKPAVADYYLNKPHIEGYKSLKAKAAGVALVLVFIGWAGIEILRLFAADIKRALWG